MDILPQTTFVEVVPFTDEKQAQLRARVSETSSVGVKVSTLCRQGVQPGQSLRGLHASQRPRNHRISDLRSF